jgi:CRP-like cAMP-binding protein
LESIAEFLRALPLLSGVRDEEIDLLARTAEERRFPAGEHIMHMGEAGVSALILREGEAEVRLEKPTGAPVQLSRIGPGELFGELALFDGEPRSASVIATRDCVAIEISRDLFLREISEQPEVALKLLSILAKRLRRSDRVVSYFADRIYGDVMPRLEAAVAAQLDSAKTICEQSKQHVASTAETAGRVLDAAEKRWSSVTRLVGIGGALLASGLTILGFFGFQQYRDFHELLDEKEQEVTVAVDEIKRERSYLKVLKETTTVFDKLRRDLQLDVSGGASRLAESPREAGREFGVAYRELKRDYLSEASKWESEILIEALELVAEISERGYVLMGESDWDVVLDAIEQAVKNPPDHWLQRQRLGSLVEVLYEDMSEGYVQGARSLVESLERRLDAQDQDREAEQQTALMLARLGNESRSVRRVLRELQEADSPWLRSEAAVDLIALGDEAGWRTLRTDLASQFAAVPERETQEERRGRGRAAFIAARRLASSVVYPPAKRHQARRLGLEAVERHLSRGALSKHLDTWPEETGFGVDLVSKTIYDRLAQRPTGANRFYWQSSCELLCGLGCRESQGADGGTLCRQCFDLYTEHYFRRGEGPDRSSERCRPGSRETTFPPD